MRLRKRFRLPAKPNLEKVPREEDDPNVIPERSGTGVRSPVATVSKALNGQHDISDATRARVREAAERLGYVPNMAARSMKTNRTYNLGVLFVDERQSGLGHEYFSAVLDSFKVRVERLGYDITFINRNLGGKTMTYLEHCHYAVWTAW